MPEPLMGWQAPVPHWASASSAPILAPGVQIADQRALLVAQLTSQGALWRGGDVGWDVGRAGILAAVRGAEAAGQASGLDGLLVLHAATGRITITSGVQVAIVVCTDTGDQERQGDAHHIIHLDVALPFLVNRVIKPAGSFIWVRYTSQTAHTQSRVKYRARYRGRVKHQRQPPVTAAKSNKGGGKQKVCSGWGLNPGPSACKADVITTTLPKHDVKSKN